MSEYYIQKLLQEEEQGFSEKSKEEFSPTILDCVYCSSLENEWINFFEKAYKKYKDLEERKGKKPLTKIQFIPKARKLFLEYKGTVSDLKLEWIANKNKMRLTSERQIG